MYDHYDAKYWRKSWEQTKKSETSPSTVVTVKSCLAYKPEGMKAKPYFSKP